MIEVRLVPTIEELARALGSTVEELVALPPEDRGDLLFSYMDEVLGTVPPDGGAGGGTSHADHSRE